VGRFFLFALLSWITGNPLLALLVIIALTVPGWLAGSRYAWRFQRWVRAQGEAGRLRRTLAMNPHDVKARTDLGAILVRHGRFREARAELEQAMPRPDDLPEANYAIGLCLLHDGEVEKGRELVERALSLNPKFGYGEPHIKLGDSRAERGEWQEAVERYRQATGIHSSSVEGWFKLGQAMERLGKRDEARAALQEAIASYRNAPWYQRSEGRPWFFRARRLVRTLR
jgi:tetratricopeptide (TPR) repeat protein